MFSLFSCCRSFCRPSVSSEENYLPDIEIEESGGTQFLGISWSNLTPFVCTDYLRLGVGIIGALTAPILSCLCYRDYTLNGLNIQRAAGFGAGIGLSLTTIAIAIKATKVLNFTARWPFEILQFLDQIYGNNGLPREPFQWKRTDGVKQGFATIFSTFCVSVLTISMNNIALEESFLPDIEEVQISNILKTDLERTPLVPERASNLMLESTPSETKWFIAEQSLKFIAGLGTIGAYRLITPFTNYIEFLLLGSFLTASSVSSLLAKIWLWQEPNILRKISRSQTKSVFEKFQKVAALASNVAVAGAFVWQDMAGFLILGALSGWSKTISIDKFSQLNSRQIPQEDVLQPIKDLIEKEGSEKIIPIFKFIVVALTVSWYVYGLSDPQETSVNRIKAFSYFSSAFLGYVLTRYTGKTFTPKESSRIINSFYFYLIHYPTLNLLPYSIIRAAQPITNQPPKTPTEEFLAYFAFILLGFPAGANRALQGLKSHQSPAEPGAVAEEFASTLFLYLINGLIV